MSAVSLLRSLLNDENIFEGGSDQENVYSGLSIRANDHMPMKGVPRHYEERRLQRIAASSPRYLCFYFPYQGQNCAVKREVLQPVSDPNRMSSQQGQECVDRLFKYGGQRLKQREKLAKEYQLQEQCEVRDTKPPPSFAGPVKNSTNTCLTLYEEGKTKLKKREAFQEREFAAMRFTPQLSEGTRILLAKGQGRPRPKKTPAPPEYSFKPTMNSESAKMLVGRPRQALYRPKPAPVPAAHSFSISDLTISPSRPTTSSPRRDPSSSLSSRSSLHLSSPPKVFVHLPSSLTSSPLAHSSDPRGLRTPRTPSTSESLLRVVSPHDLLSSISRKSVPKAVCSPSNRCTNQTDDGDDTENDEEFVHSTLPSSTTIIPSFLSEAFSTSDTLNPKNTIKCDKTSTTTVYPSSLQQHIERQAVARQRRAEAAIPVHVTGANWKPRRKPKPSQTTEHQNELNSLLQELVSLNQS